MEDKQSLLSVPRDSPGMGGSECVYWEFLGLVQLLVGTGGTVQGEMKMFFFHWYAVLLAPEKTEYLLVGLKQLSLYNIWT